MVGPIDRGRPESAQSAYDRGPRQLVERGGGLPISGTARSDEARDRLAL